MSFESSWRTPFRAAWFSGLTRILYYGNFETFYLQRQWKIRTNFTDFCEINDHGNGGGLGLASHRSNSERTQLGVIREVSRDWLKGALIRCLNWTVLRLFRMNTCYVEGRLVHWFSSRKNLDTFAEILPLPTKTCHFPGPCNAITEWSEVLCWKIGLHLLDCWLVLLRARSLIFSAHWVKTYIYSLSYVFFHNSLLQRNIEKSSEGHSFS